MTRYIVTKVFTDGLLEGLSVDDETNVEFELGKEYKGVLGSSDYKVVAIRDLEAGLYLKEIRGKRVCLPIPPVRKLPEGVTVVGKA